MAPRRTFVFLLLLVSLFAVTAQAREVIVTPVDPSTVQGLGEARATSVCDVGNTNPAAFAISNFLLPPEEYALVFDPEVSACAGTCAGFQVTNVHILLQTTTAATVQMTVGMRSAVQAAAPGCYQPGPVECSTGPYQVNIPQGGLWNVSLPVTCACAFENYRYALSVVFHSTTAALSLVTDSLPSACVSWNDYGTGFTDLFTIGFPGNLKIWADTQCCEQPIGTQQESMGSLKGRFED